MSEDKENFVSLSVTNNRWVERHVLFAAINDSTVFRLLVCARWDAFMLSVFKLLAVPAYIIASVEEMMRARCAFRARAPGVEKCTLCFSGLTS